MDLYNDTQMDGKTPVEQAKEAIKHVLRVIRDNPDAGYHLGVGTQSFDLLTEAMATMLGKKVEDIRIAFQPTATRLSDSKKLEDVKEILSSYKLLTLPKDELLKKLADVLNN